jgi:hypothetical protein
MFTASNDEVVEFTLRLASSSPAMTWEEVSEWLGEHVLTVARARKVAKTWYLQVARLMRIDQQLREL